MRVVRGDRAPFGAGACWSRHNVTLGVFCAALSHPEGHEFIRGMDAPWPDNVFPNIVTCTESQASAILEAKRWYLWYCAVKSQPGRMSARYAILHSLTY